MFSPVSFKEPNSSIAVTLKSPAVFIKIPLANPEPSVSSFSDAVKAALSIVLISPE